MYRILVIDDNLDLAKIYSFMLGSAAEYKVIDSAPNGIEGINKYFQHNPDIILMDHRMPGKDGLETTTEILNKDKDAKIIFTSADVSIKSKALTLGAKAFLSKPFTENLLISTLREVIKS